MLLFAKEFFISYFNARDNITETERKLDIITSIPVLTQKRITRSKTRSTTISCSAPISTC